VTLADLVGGRPFICGPEATIAEVAGALTARGHGSAGVIQGRTLLGVVTERDLVRAVAAGVDPGREPVHRWMGPDPDTFAADTDVFEAAEWLLEAGYRHLPVVDAHGELLGIVSLRDLLRSILASLEEE